LFLFFVFFIFIFVVYFKKNKAKPSGSPLASPEFFWKVVKDKSLLSGRWNDKVEF